MATTLRFCDDETNGIFFENTVQAVITGVFAVFLTLGCCHFYIKLFEKRMGNPNVDVPIQYKLLCICATGTAFVDVFTTCIGKIGCTYSLSITILRWPAGITLISHELGQLCLVIIFILRIKMTFENTPYHPCKISLRLIYGQLIFITLTVIVATVMYRLKSQTIGLTVAAIAASIFFTVEISVVRLFLKGLQDVCLIF